MTLCYWKWWVQLLSAPNPVQSLGLWKGTFALSWMLATRVGAGVGWEWFLSKGWLTPTDNQRARAFTGEGSGLHAETAQSALRVTLKLFIGLTNIILIILSIVNVHFQGQFVPIYLNPMLRIVLVHVWHMTSLSGHHAVNFLYLVGISVSTTAHRIWLRILSIALEKDLKLLALLTDFAAMGMSCLTAFLCFCIFQLLWLSLFFG